MAQMSIRFHPDRNDLIFPDLEAGEAINGEIAEVVVVANGVSGGDGKTRPSVVIRIDTTEGPVVVLTTARLVETLARAILAKHPELMEGD